MVESEPIHSLPVISSLIKSKTIIVCSTEDLLWVAFCDHVQRSYQFALCQVIQGSGVVPALNQPLDGVEKPGKDQAGRLAGWQIYRSFGRGDRAR